MTSFSVDLDRIVRKIREKRAKLVLVQAPEGLLPSVEPIIDDLERETDATIILSLDPCYGGCDVAWSTAHTFGADMIVHLGHTPIVKGKDDVLFLDCTHRVKLKSKLIRDIAAHVCDCKHLGLVCSLQYVNTMKQLADALSNLGFRTYIGKPSTTGMKSGQVTGCDVSAARDLPKHVEAVIVVSSGLFHGLGVSLYTARRTILADVFNSRVVDMERERKRRLALIVDMIERAKEARELCVLVGTKSGQSRLQDALRIRNELQRLGKVTKMACISDLRPGRLLHIRAEAFVQTLCPRISIDDIEVYERPMLSLEQVPIMLERLAFWEVYPA